MENKYHHSKIYKLHTDDLYFYIGATTQKLCARYQDHLNTSKHHPERKVYQQFTHEKFMTKQVKITLIEEITCENVEQLRRKEDEHICKHIQDPKCLNSVYAILNTEKRNEYIKKYLEENREKHKQYYEDNKEELLSRQKERYEENKESIRLQRKQFRENNAEKIREEKKIYYQRNQEAIKLKTREYQQENSEKINTRKNEYRERNKEKISEYKKLRIKCECGAEIRKDGIRRHEKTTNHIKSIENKNKM